MDGTPPGGVADPGLDSIPAYRVYPARQPRAETMNLTIGQVAAAAAVNIQTIRYYERRGLVTAPRRTASGYRQYGDDAVARLRFIKHAQDLGFSLAEIQGLLALRVRRAGRCNAVERTARQKIELVEKRIQDLRRLKRTLERLAAACAARQPTEDCPILEALEDRAIPS
jgi:Hg(II)-responsive transcriptional regulator